MKYFFYILNCLLFACATLVIGVHNPIHSILLLIAVFALGSILLISLNIEFFAIVFLIVYVGAIVVLFLFIIMMWRFTPNCSASACSEGRRWPGG